MLSALVILSLISFSLSAGNFEQVHVSLISNYDQTELLVMWASSSTVGNVKYGISKHSYDYQVSASFTSYTIVPNIVPNYVSPNLFSAILSEAVKPGSTYFYVVGNGTAYSEEFNVSIPALGQQTLTIALTGDLGADSNSSKSIQTLAGLKADIILHAGDLSYADTTNNQSVWDVYGNMLQPLIANTLYNPAVGNHVSSR